MTQLTRIEEILIRDGKIDNFYCIHNRISLRLGARIQDLEDKGYVFRTERLPNKNYIYHLVAVPKAQQLELV
jgi:Helix-turn-helix domain